MFPGNAQQRKYGRRTKLPLLAILLSMGLSLFAPVFKSLEAQTPLGRMKCCRKSSTCCCKRAPHFVPPGGKGETLISRQLAISEPCSANCAARYSSSWFSWRFIERSAFSLCEPPAIQRTECKRDDNTPWESVHPHPSPRGPPISSSLRDSKSI